MIEELLRTKLTAPPGRVDLVPRTRLFHDLEATLSLPVTLITAPAGSGKTSLLRSWRSSPNGKSALVAWLSLDEDDNGPIRFWSYIIGALETCLPGIGESVRDVLQTAQTGSLEPALTTLLNALSEVNDQCVLVLDDYHVIEAPEIHQSLTFFIERLPPGISCVLLSRSDPPLPLARWRAKGLLSELRVRDLRFTGEESADLLRSGAGNRLSQDQVALLTARTEGWAAGLHLASLALRNREDVNEFVETFTGSHRFVLTYLIDEVLAGLEESTQQFLMQSSILSQLSAELCEAVTGRDDAGEILDHVHAANLFLVPLDETGQWYRYHHLFADVLQHRLTRLHPEDLPSLHCRAARWYEANGMTLQAIDHFSRGGEYDEAARLIKSSERGRGTAGEAEMVRNWLARLPEDVIRQDPLLGLAGAWSHLVTGPLSDVETWLTPVEHALDRDSSRHDRAALSGEVAAIRAMVASFSGDISTAIARAEDALDQLPVDQVHLRSVVAMSLGQAHRFDGNLQASERTYREAAELGLQAGNLYAAIDSLSDLGLVLMRLGRLHEAEQVFRRARDEVRRRNAEDLPEAGSVGVIMPELLRERGQLTEALDLVKRGIKLGQRAAKMDLLITGFRGLALIHWAQGEWDDAYAALATSRQYASQYGLTHTVRGIDVREAQMRLAQGDLPAAESWLRSYQPDEDLPGSVQEAEQLMLARIYAALGDSDPALQLLEPLRVSAEREGRKGDLIGILAVQSLALQSAGKNESGLQTLREALRLAEPEGYKRVFLDEGEPMVRLLTRAVERGIHVEFAQRLLGETGTAVVRSLGNRGNRTGSLIEPLSEREQAVLRLLPAGLSSPEIASELYVAPSTVRSHLKSIYRKLDVHSRDQAITRARELDLL